jgi:hypothetical protein
MHDGGSLVTSEVQRSKTNLPPSGVFLFEQGGKILRWDCTENDLCCPWWILHTPAPGSHSTSIEFAQSLDYLWDR